MGTHQEDGAQSASRSSYTILWHTHKGHFVLPQGQLLNHVPCCSFYLLTLIKYFISNIISHYSNIHACNTYLCLSKCLSIYNFYWAYVSHKSILIKFIYLFNIPTTVCPPFFPPISSPHVSSVLHHSNPLLLCPVQKWADLPWVSPKHRISSCSKTKTPPPCIKAGQGNPV